MRPAAELVFPFTLWSNGYCSRWAAGGRRWQQYVQSDISTTRGIPDLAETLLLGLAGVIVLAVGAQWLAWRIQLPSILLLLVFGFLAGPILHLVEPGEMFGEVLFPLVSIAVAIILFEGGLTLRMAELPEIGPIVFRLISIGALVTWALAGLAAYYILDMALPLAVLLGAILIVTGPTVVMPLLRQVRPRGQVGAALKWEGILIDPVGAVLAVLVFEAIRQGNFAQAPSVILVGVFQTVFVGVGAGLLASGILVLMLRRYLIPDYLQNSVALMLVVAFFAISNSIVPESGLVTVTVMGVALANQRWVSVKQIADFKENLQVLLIGILFIVLAARLRVSDFSEFVWVDLAFVLVLILVARPLTVLLSTIGTRFNWRERLFLSWMAPRGIVAASVASIFAFELVAEGFAEAAQLVPLTFLVIVVTVVFYGLTAGPVARWLGLAEKDPQGMLLVGAGPLSRAIGHAVADLGFRVLLVDTNWVNVKTAQMEGLRTHYGNALQEETLEAMDYSGIGRLLALTSNNEVNSLATLLYSEVFGRADVYQLPPTKTGRRDAEIEIRSLPGRLLFNDKMNCEYLLTQLETGAIIRATPITEEFSYVNYQTHYDNTAVPLFLVTERGQIEVYTTDYQPIPRPGQQIVSLIPDDGSAPTIITLPQQAQLPAPEPEPPQDGA